jgi:hypothetical protein
MDLVQKIVRIERINMPNLKCHLGVCGSGKDHRCKQLIKQGYTQINVAGELREMTWNLLDWRPYNEEQYEKFKNNPIGTLAVNKIYIRLNLKDLINELKLPYDCDTLWDILFPNDAGTQGRVLLQNLGTVIKEVHEAYWAKKWSEKVNKFLNKGKDICCSDIRYMDEVNEALKLNGSYAVDLEDFVFTEFIFCDYHSDRYEPDNPHVSERLAQYLLRDSFKDGDIVSREYLREIEIL